MTAEDPCCIVCTSTTGVCLSLHQCHHHKQAQKQLAADDLPTLKAMWNEAPAEFQDAMKARAAAIQATTTEQEN